MRSAPPSLHQTVRIDIGVVDEPDVKLIAFAVDLGDAGALALQAQRRRFEQMANACGQLTVTVLELGTNLGERGLILSARDLLVDAQALILFRDVIRVDA